MLQITSANKKQEACPKLAVGKGDGVLRWFEAYADALDRRYYQVMPTQGSWCEGHRILYQPSHHGLPLCSSRRTPHYAGIGLTYHERCEKL
jgi:hypothetical protein